MNISCQIDIVSLLVRLRVEIVLVAVGIVGSIVSLLVRLRVEMISSLGGDTEKASASS